MSLSRELVFGVAAEKVNEKIAFLQNQIDDLSRGADIKSTSGDKHETARAMMHLQQEQLTGQLNEARSMLAKLTTLRDVAYIGKINDGSLIKTDKAYFYLSVALGKLVIDETPVYFLSANSPLGKMLMGKSKDDLVSLNQANYRIENVY